MRFLSIQRHLRVTGVRPAMPGFDFLPQDKSDHRSRHCEQGGQEVVCRGSPFTEPSVEQDRVIPDLLRLFSQQPPTPGDDGRSPRDSPQNPPDDDVHRFLFRQSPGHQRLDLFLVHAPVQEQRLLDADRIVPFQVIVTSIFIDIIPDGTQMINGGNTESLLNGEPGGGGSWAGRGGGGGVSPMIPPSGRRRPSIGGGVRPGRNERHRGGFPRIRRRPQGRGVPSGSGRPSRERRGRPPRRRG